LLKSSNKKAYKHCERLWDEIVFIRSGGKCELTGQTNNCSRHHYWGKSTYALRFDPNNGVYLTYKKHIAGVHSTDPSISTEARKELDEYMVKREGVKGVEKIKMQKNVIKSDIKLIEIYLMNYLNNLREGLSDR
jgi:hypothetical protein